MAHLEVKPKSAKSTWWIWLLIAILVIAAVIYFTGAYTKILNAGSPAVIATPLLFGTT
jgi:hypothetical protein